jgi:hypothetical protein
MLRSSIESLDRDITLLRALIQEKDAAVSVKETKISELKAKVG